MVVYVVSDYSKPLAAFESEQVAVNYAEGLRDTSDKYRVTMVPLAQGGTPYEPIYTPNRGDA